MGSIPIPPLMLTVGISMQLQWGPLMSDKNKGANFLFFIFISSSVLLLRENVVKLIYNNSEKKFVLFLYLAQAAGSI